MAHLTVKNKSIRLLFSLLVCVPGKVDSSKTRQREVLLLSTVGTDALEYVLFRESPSSLGELAAGTKPL